MFTTLDETSQLTHNGAMWNWYSNDGDCAFPNFLFSSENSAIGYVAIAHLDGDLGEDGSPVYRSAASPGTYSFRSLGREWTLRRSHVKVI